jgi:5-methylcytosine-specific restriction endonuclease McrA
MYMSKPLDKLAKSHGYKNYFDYLRSPHWRETRFKVLKKSGFKCGRCGSRGKLNVHHLTYLRFGRERISDLEVLCERCHRKVHGIKEKGLMSRMIEMLKGRLD